MNTEDKQFFFEIDDLLASSPDVHTFGFNLTCAWPFPSPLAEIYSEFSESVRKLDRALYIYPLSQTHITIMTLVNFKDTVGLDSSQQKNFESLIDDTILCLSSLFSDSSGCCIDGPIQLHFDKAVLAQKAAYLLFNDPTDRVGRLRNAIAKLLVEKIPELHPLFSSIVHSTFLRFVGTPSNPTELTESFNVLAKKLDPTTITIPEIFLTAETKPYMRSGDIRHIFSLNKNL